ncbi:MAG: hypothetical protein RLZZ142_132, partial [Verrucomicrobiota bacterium]
MNRPPSLLLVLLSILLPLSQASAQSPDTPRKPRVFFLIAEPEYGSAITLPAFAKAQLEPLGIQCTFSIQTDETSDSFPGLETLPSADLLFLSVRRKTPPNDQLELIRTHVAAGKPVAGMRTASHAFSKKNGAPPTPATPGASWESFDKDILGGSYGGHYGTGIATLVSPLPEALRHPILSGFPPTPFRCPSHLYKNPVLAPTVTPLLQGQLENAPQTEPVAWVNVLDKQRVFYTSLGSAEDFQVPQFQRLLRNGILWSLGIPIPQEPA